MHGADGRNEMNYNKKERRFTVEEKYGIDGEKVYRQRFERSYTQEELSEKSGVSRSQIQIKQYIKSNLHENFTEGQFSGSIDNLLKNRRIL